MPRRRAFRRHRRRPTIRNGPHKISGTQSHLRKPSRRWREVARARPAAEPTKVAISLRLTRAVEHFKADGPGWQTRMDKALKKAAGCSGGSPARLSALQWARTAVIGGEPAVTLQRAQDAF
jgi:uncharacterized protein (DUF4415 family)